MKLNHDCVRDLLLFAEEHLEYGNRLFVNEASIKDYATTDLIYAADKLYEAGYIDADKHVFFGSHGIPSIEIKSITWDGHQFLDNVRDDGVWKNTKNIISGFASASIGIINNVATQVISGMIKSNLGL